MEVPEILNKVVDFFKFWQNPDNVEGDAYPIKEFQLQIYSVSMEFVFKWLVSKEEFEQAANFMGEQILENQKSLQMSLGEYNIELAYV